GQQCHLARVLDGPGHLALLLGVVARDSTGPDLGPVGLEPPKQVDVLVVDVLDPLLGEQAHLLLAAAGVVLVLAPLGGRLRHQKGSSSMSYGGGSLAMGRPPLPPERPPSLRLSFLVIVADAHF